MLLYKYRNNLYKNMNKIKLTIIVLISMTLGVITFNKAIEIKKDLQYAKCMRQYVGANFINCEDRDIVYIQATTTSPINAGVTPPVVNSEEKKVKTTVTTTCNPSTNPEVNRLLNKYFKDCETVKTAWAISQAESKGKQVKIGYNCYYKNGVVYEERVAGAKSGACKSEHNKYAWSKDLGYLQLNDYFHSACGDLQDLETNIKCASKVYKEAGNSFTPWVTYNQGLHLSYK